MINVTKVVSCITTNVVCENATAQVGILYISRGREYKAVIELEHNRDSQSVEMKCGKIGNFAVRSYEGLSVKHSTKKAFIAWVDEAINDLALWQRLLRRWVNEGSTNLCDTLRKITAASATVFTTQTYAYLHELLNAYKNTLYSMPEEEFRNCGMFESTKEMVEACTKKGCYEVYPYSVKVGQPVFNRGRSGTVVEISEGEVYVKFSGDQWTTKMPVETGWKSLRSREVVKATKALLIGLWSGDMGGRQEMMDLFRTFGMTSQMEHINRLVCGDVFGRLGSVYYISGMPNMDEEGFIQATSLKTRETIQIPTTVCVSIPK